MEQARCLLEKSDLAIKEVAAMVGYKDPLYFSRIFKSVNAIAPGHYRAAQRV